MNGRAVDFAGIIRYLDEPKADNHSVDIGGRAGVEFKDIHYSLEAIERWRSKALTPEDDQDNTRVLGNIRYGVNQSTHIGFSFGKNYGIDFTGAGSLIASFGLTLGLGPVPLGTAD